MERTKKIDTLTTSRVLWIGLTLSPMIFGLALLTKMPDLVFSIPLEYAPLEMVALLGNLLLFVTYAIHEKKIRPIKDMDQRVPWYVMCWGLHEGIALLAFVATFIGQPGHFLIFGVNLTVATFGNVIMFPKQPTEPVK